MKLKETKILLLLSFITTCIISIIPSIGIRYEGDYRFYGFPADIFGLYGNGSYSLAILGLIFDLIFFYVIFLLLSKLFSKLSSQLKNHK
ncbi:hypothetical protein BK137_15005 [Viridibacillus arenosi]|uniref:Uncharacterized protein n=1 Tax=Viridibacillus arenosi FSL R5-213 TaxID=1227360 RepID=W4EVQ2_9BACL|nr:hypothetical protein C176_12328 [Viridibacillus arenosi FSL R5-213]OMC90053.1 hypothetical protein BK137_15005 [Viridibacillus arenosi]